MCALPSKAVGKKSSPPQGDRGLVPRTEVLAFPPPPVWTLRTLPLTQGPQVALGVGNKAPLPRWAPGCRATLCRGLPATPSSVTVIPTTAQAALSSWRRIPQPLLIPTRT